MNAGLRKICVVAISALWCLFALMQCLRLIVIKRNNIFAKKDRTKSPGCLRDPEFGQDCVVRVTNVQLHYKISGPEWAPLMIMLHGFPEFWYSWRHQIKHFNSFYRVVAVDLRGYGGSSKPAEVEEYTITKLVDDIAALIQALGYESGVVIGHDWGGVLAWVLSIRYPNLLDKVCVINCPHPVAFASCLQRNWKQFLSSWYMFFVNVPYLPEWYFMAGDLNQIDNVFTGKALGAKKGTFTEEDMEAIKHSFNKRSDVTGPMNYIRCSVRGLNSYTGYNKKIRDVPILLLWGTKDGALSKEMAAASRQFVGHFKLQLIDGASHWAHQEEPELINKYIDNFLLEAPRRYKEAQQIIKTT